MTSLKQLRTEMRTAIEKATSGPWESDQCGDVWSTTAPKRYEEWAEAYLFRTIGTTRTGPDPGDAAYIALANPANLKRLLDALDAAEEALVTAQIAIKRNDQHHEEFDEYDGYSDSELQEINFNAIAVTRSALKALEDGG